MTYSWIENPFIILPNIGTALEFVGITSPTCTRKTTKARKTVIPHDSFSP